MEGVEMDKPLLYFDEIAGARDYDAAFAEKHEPPKIPGRGQMKLLVCELVFLNRLHLHGMLDGSVIVYVGSAPGRHICCLHSHFQELGVSLKWVLIDGRKHDPCLSGLRNVTTVTRFADEAYLRELRGELRRSKIVLISDIRSNRVDTEPTTADLLRDYALQNTMVSVLKPVASSLKWRCPFPDSWEKDFYVPCGKEMLQPFAPLFSAEMRLLTVYSETRPKLRLITLSDAVNYEKRMFYLNSVVRQRVILNFDYPNQEYDFFHMFCLLSSVVCSCEFKSPKEKVLSLQNRFFRFLRIPPSITLGLRRHDEPPQHAVPGQDPLPKGRGKKRPLRGGK
ncbi:poly(A) polymerase subunit [Orf virus]|nr:poly(A) polymerase subunit [Orf virus]